MAGKSDGLKEFLTAPDDSPVVQRDQPELHATETPINIEGKNKPDLVVKLGKALESLKGLMKSAEAAVDYTRDGMRALVAAFPSQKTTIQKVKLPKDLVDVYGGNADALQFGAITLKDDAQYTKLQKDVEMAKKYFGEDIHLHRITYNDGRPPVAIVMNVDATEFNAVISAERKKEQLEHFLLQARKEMPGLSAQNEQNLDKTAQLAGKAPIDKAPEIAAALPGFAPGMIKEGGFRDM